MNSKRTALMLSAAILGMSHTSPVGQPAPAAVVQAQQSAAPPQTWEGGD